MLLAGMLQGGISVLERTPSLPESPTPLSVRLVYLNLSVEHNVSCVCVGFLSSLHFIGPFSLSLYTCR